MNIIVSVTTEDIVLGRPEHIFKCPVARAINRVLNKYAIVTVRGDIRIRHFVNSLEFIDIKSNEQVSDFVFNFDNHWPVSPFTFELDVPEQYIIK